jgi:hypothetical protein
MTNNFLSIHWDGYCPESALKGEKVRMRLNRHDFFESEATGLQICIVPDLQAVILKFRGDGSFKKKKTYGHEIAHHEILSPQNKDTPMFNYPVEVFESNDAIKDYIQNQLLK